jgi:hypothetical protein
MRPWARKLVAEIDQRYQQLIDREMARPRRRWIGAFEIAELETREHGFDDEQESRRDLLREIALAVEDGAFEAGDRMTVVWLPKALFIYYRLDRRLLQRLELRIQRNRFAALKRTESRQDFLENVVGRLAVRVDAYLRWRCARGLTGPLPAPFGDAPSVAEPAVEPALPADLPSVSSETVYAAVSPSSAPPVTDVADDPTTSPGDPAAAELRDPVTDEDFKAWYKKRVEECQKSGRWPTREEDWKDANKELGLVSHTRVRKVRSEIAPELWTKRGRRGSSKNKLDAKK